MTEQVEWEVVDATDAPRAGKSRHARPEILHAMLGRGWKWKLAGSAVVALLTLAVLATLTGAIVLLFAAGTLLSVGLRKLKQWLGQEDKRSTSPVKL